MHNLDFSPLFRATVGFDRMADMMDRVLSADGTESTYPPYNIEKKSDDNYRISLAVAGFAEDELSVELRENALIVSAKKGTEAKGRTYLHRGIANRAFEHRFQLADHLRVTGATHENGMLHIDLVREIPEALKPRKIAISSGETVDVKAVEAEPKQATAKAA